MPFVSPNEPGTTAQHRSFNWRHRDSWSLCRQIIAKSAGSSSTEMNRLAPRESPPDMDMKRAKTSPWLWSAALTPSLLICGLGVSTHRL